MLDIRRVRENPDEVKAAVERRGKGDYGIDELIECDKKRRKLLSVMEQLKHTQKEASGLVPKLKKEGKDTTELFSKMKKLSSKVKELEKEVSDVEARQKELLLNIPNTPNESVPTGEDDSDNVEMWKFKEPTKFDFEPKAHWEIGENLDILDFERGAKLSGARFTVYKKLAARLERSVISFMLDLHTIDQDYDEILPPFMVNREAMIGTGQLPKFEDDMYHIEDTDQFLIPTAEVPVTNLYDGEILSVEDLPIYHTAYTPCFRKEAGSAGRETRGLIRQHQFNKVELV